MSSNLKVNSLVPATGTEIGIGTTGGSIDFRCPATFGGNVTIGGTLTYDEVINIDSIGIITARTGLNVSSGTATFAGAIDANGDLDVDGHTNLDNVSIAGVVTATTFSGSGANLTALNASNISSGTVPIARLGSGTASSSKFLRGDSTFQNISTLFVNLNHGQNFLDDQNLIFGDASDMILIHQSSGAKSRLRNTNDSGSLDIESTLTRFLNKDGSTEKLRITSDGKLALGRTSADEMIHITHDDNSDHYGGIKINANNGSVYVKYGWRGLDGSQTLRFAIGGTEKLRIDGNGKFLFGVTSARSGFFNTASQFNPHFQIEGAGDADDPGRVTSIIYNSTTTAGPTLLFGKTNTGSVGGTGAVGNHHGLGLITFQGMVGGQFTQGATIAAAVSGSPGDNDLPTHLSFGTCADGAASASERLRITSGGNVGIGTNNPADILDINSDSASAVTNMYLRNHANLGGAALNIWTQGTYASPTYKAIIGCSDAGGNIRMGAHSNHELLLLTNNTPRVTVKTGGDVEIADGNLIVASGHGIDFSATSDATTMVVTGVDPTTDSEVLTDYEHGTWTPRLRAYDHTGGAGWGTMKYTDGTDVTGSGRYVRMGNHVWCGFKFESGSKVFDSNWTYWSIDNTPYGANHYDKASGSLYVSQTNFFTNSNGMIGGFVHGNESYMVVNKPDGHANATINTSNNNRYCYGHISIYTSRT